MTDHKEELSKIAEQIKAQIKPDEPLTAKDTQKVESKSQPSYQEFRAKHGK